MEVTKHKNRFSFDPHQAVEGKKTVEELKGLAITLFSGDRSYASYHYNTLNALFKKQGNQAVIPLIKRVMHLFIDEQMKHLSIEPIPQKLQFSHASFDKKEGEEMLSLIHVGALSKIEAFTQAIIEKLFFDDYTFELRLYSFSNLKIPKNLLKKGELRALQAFSQPAVLLVKIQRIYIEMVCEGETPFVVHSASLPHASCEVRKIETVFNPPTFSSFYDDELAQELQKLFPIENEASKKDDFEESPPVVSENNLIFKFDDIL